MEPYNETQATTECGRSPSPKSMGGVFNFGNLISGRSSIDSCQNRSVEIDTVCFQDQTNG